MGVKKARSGRRPTIIFLVGFMGAGKTAVGRSLARRLGWRFADLDRLVERRERRAIGEIFQNSGESGFRKAETAALRELLAGPAPARPFVAALGGGTLVAKINRRLLAGTGKVVFLQAALNELRRRCRRAGALRPLLGDAENFARLYSARRKSYGTAHLTVETSGKKPAEVAAEIAREFGLAPARRRALEAR